MMKLSATATRGALPAGLPLEIEMHDFDPAREVNPMPFAQVYLGDVTVGIYESEGRIVVDIDAADQDTNDLLVVTLNDEDLWRGGDA